MEKCINFNKEINNFIKTFTKYKTPIQVNFRSLVSILSSPDRATHLIHPYPAKLLMHIPYFFFNNNITGFNSETTVDPFCGSGTVLLESQIAGKKSFGIDVNPLAMMISEVKTEKYSLSKLINFNQTISENLSNKTKNEIQNEEQLNYWFTESVKKQLANLLQSINIISNPKYKKFFYICFSNCIKKVSLADLKISVPVKLNMEKYSNSESSSSIVSKRIKELENVNVFDKFNEIVKTNIKRVKNLNELRINEGEVNLIPGDTRKISLGKSTINKIKESSIDLVITSPPYAGAQKYVRATKLSLLWLNIADKSELKNLDMNTIGRENYPTKDYANLIGSSIVHADKLFKEIFKINPLRAHIASNYLNEMRVSLKEIFNMLKPEGHLIIIIGNNYICGKEFRTQEYISHILKTMGLTLLFVLIDDIKSYGLMTKRNKTANIISREYILVFKK